MAQNETLVNCTIGEPGQNSDYLQKFRLYETRSRFYMIGRNKNRTCWRVLKIDRLEPTELNIVEDSTTYSKIECCDLLNRIHEGNKKTGGLKFVTICYGIIGFVRFLGPYYMLIIKERRKIGAICGHAVYAINKSEMIPIPNSFVRSKLAHSNNENRFKKLLCTIDLTKDFYFSYSYNIMHSIQNNISDNKIGLSLYDSMFVWNEFLTRGIRNKLKNTTWTVALVYGFFKQVDLTVSDRNIKLTLIARRSRYFAGTRYLRRGVNENGKVANDIETEQIVFENAPDGGLMQISSIVQNRGSIPLFWSQAKSRINIRPNIILSKKDSNYEATRLHFDNLVERYGNPLIILNLIKSYEKKPRETILLSEFVNAIRIINASLTDDNNLRFLHWDLNKHSKSKNSNVLYQLNQVATIALSLTGIFYCQVTRNLEPTEQNNEDNCSPENASGGNESADNMEKESNCGGYDDGTSENCSAKTPMFQKGVLRTNCIDCLDRTNVAQYAYGLVALGHQMHALGLIKFPEIDLDNPLAEDLMRVYEGMGDALALQYGGSAAHNKIFCELRGQWKAATRSQELFRNLQRIYSNTYLDGLKQSAINVFLGYYQAEEGKQGILEPDSHHQSNVERTHSTAFKRSLSDGNILRESNRHVASAVAQYGGCLPENAQGGGNSFSKSTPELSACESDVSYCRETLERQFLENNHISYNEHDDESSFSNFLHVNWLSSGNLMEDEAWKRFGSFSSGKFETSSNKSGSIRKVKEQCETELRLICGTIEFTEKFVKWVNNEDQSFFEINQT